MNATLRSAMPLLATLTLAALPPAGQAADAAASGAIATVAGMPPVVDPTNLYSETSGPEHVGAALKDDLVRVYVPNLRGNSVSVIDPAKMRVVDTLKVGQSPQHVVVGHDLRTLWAANNAERSNNGSLTPIDPRTGKTGAAIPVDDPYNMYFTPDGKSAIIVAEARHRLDFRDPKTMAMQYQIDAPKCGGINHADFSIDGKTAFFTCEFEGSIARIDLVGRKVTGYLVLPMPATRLKDKFVANGGPTTEVCTSKKGMPQDIRFSPNGKKLYVADMEADGVHVIDAAAFKETAFISTGVAAHGLYPSRDGKKLYIANRGSHRIHGPRHGPGSVAVMDFASEKIVANWAVPGGGSPDMGNVTADGKYLWLSGRYDDVVYRFDTASGAVQQIAVGQEPHGLTVWPQPGRYSLGHTGNLR
jgi:YVTN family beta-propeller protein